jgi:hypothetical protein
MSIMSNGKMKEGQRRREEEKEEKEEKEVNTYSLRKR